MPRRAIHWFGALALVALLGRPGLGLAQNFGANPADTYFRITWEVTSGRGGTPVISGYIHNDSGWHVREMSLRIIALDAAGAVRDEKLVWAASEVPAGSRTYFEALAPPGATWRVSVHSFDLFKGGP